jgi:hypothetical protein
MVSSFGKNNMNKIKPVEMDAHFKYSCPECSSFHWISFKAAKVPGYMIVCDSCGQPSLVETIQSLDIVYLKEPISSETKSSLIPNKLMKTCLKSMKAYGFGEEESIEAIRRAFKETSSLDPLVIIKNATKQFIGAENV